uniref:Uncharacterized protein n=2 Tax=Panagrolaimus sp. JU765 TaxID=591449 RepID=A0AC34PUE3_9BILA
MISKKPSDCRSCSPKQCSKPSTKNRPKSAKADLNSLKTTELLSEPNSQRWNLNALMNGSSSTNSVLISALNGSKSLQTSPSSSEVLSQKRSMDENQNIGMSGFQLEQNAVNLIKPISKDMRQSAFSVPVNFAKPITTSSLVQDEKMATTSSSSSNSSEKNQTIVSFPTIPQINILFQNANSEPQTTLTSSANQSFLQPQMTYRDSSELQIGQAQEQSISAAVHYPNPNVIPNQLLPSNASSFTQPHILLPNQNVSTQFPQIFPNLEGQMNPQFFAMPQTFQNVKTSLPLQFEQQNNLAFQKMILAQNQLPISLANMAGFDARQNQPMPVFPEQAISNFTFKSNGLPITSNVMNNSNQEIQSFLPNPGFSTQISCKPILNFMSRNNVPKANVLTRSPVNNQSMPQSTMMPNMVPPTNYAFSNFTNAFEYSKSLPQTKPNDDLCRNQQPFSCSPLIEQIPKLSVKSPGSGQMFNNLDLQAKNQLPHPEQPVSVPSVSAHSEMDNMEQNITDEEFEEEIEEDEGIDNGNDDDDEPQTKKCRIVDDTNLINSGYLDRMQYSMACLVNDVGMKQ